MRSTTETVRTIDLGYDQMMVFDGGRDGRVRVLFGATWLTQEDDAEDAILRAGAERTLRGGRTVIEALEPTRLQIDERIGRRIAGPSDWLRSVWRSMRQRVARQQLGPISVQSCT